MIEPEVGLGTDIVVPDLAGWREERFPRTEEANWISVAPDWVCEILSPAAARIDRVKKMHLYARHRVAYSWLTDPLLTSLEVFRLESGRWSLLGVFAQSDRVRAEPFDRIELNLAALWLERR